jgi:ectoine hydroxylase-related dioxygenase (phytanoyl-CoA dioxygenase family)
MDAMTHINEFHEQGYTIIESLLSAEEISTIRTALSPFLQGKLMGRNNFEGFHTERVYALLAKDPAFSLIVEHPAVLSILDELLEPDYLLSANLAINCHPGETPQPLHRDNDGGNYGNLDHLHGVSTIWNLDAFNENNGATEIVPGSHRSGGKQPGEQNVIKVCMPAGSVIVFSGSLYHRGGANKSDKPRLAITPQYCQPWLRQLENMVLSVPPEKAAALSPRVQALLGYSIRTPGFMGYVDGVHPKRLIDDSYKGRIARGKPS